LSFYSDYFYSQRKICGNKPLIFNGVQAIHRGMNRIWCTGKEVWLAESRNSSSFAEFRESGEAAMDEPSFLDCEYRH
jgi:hypothetical protein